MYALCLPCKFYWRYNQHERRLCYQLLPYRRRFLRRLPEGCAAAELGSIVIAEALKRGNVKGEWLDEVMFGNVLSAAQGQNVARQCMVKAGVP